MSSIEINLLIEKFYTPGQECNIYFAESFHDACMKGISQMYRDMVAVNADNPHHSHHSLYMSIKDIKNRHAITQAEWIDMKREFKKFSLLHYQNNNVDLGFYSTNFVTIKNVKIDNSNIEVGVTCKKCKTHAPYATANQPNGDFICYSCLHPAG
jgi:formylmethanofuran dehydrogenase subunit E